MIMSEKHLTEPPWKTLVLKSKVKDTGLQKALQAYAKIEAAKDPAQALETLEEIALQAAKIKKANPALKEVVEYLDELLKEVPKTKRTLAALPKPEEPKAEKLAEPEEEAEGAGLKVRLINALKKVKAGEGAESIRFVVCLAKPFCGVLLAKSASDRLGPAHKKELTELTKGTKFVEGSCLFEKEAHTFVVETVPAGLASKLKKALKEHTGLTYKVRVRDPEGKVVADGDTDVEVEETAPPPVPTAAPPASTEAMSSFTTRFKSLQPEILKAIATKTPHGDSVRQRAAEAGGLAGKKDFEQANKVLDAVELLLKNPPAPPPPDPLPSAAATTAEPKPAIAPKPAPPPVSDPGAPPRDIKLSTYLSGRANLRMARENAAKELQRLREAILAKSKDEPFYAEVETKSQKLFDYLAPIDDSVANKLDDAGKCLDPEMQVELNNQVRALIQKQLASLRGHALAPFVEKNLFGKFIIKQSLEVTLSALDKQLS
jgi:hypothetical protein